MAKETGKKLFNLPFLKKEEEPAVQKKEIPRLKMIFFIVDWQQAHVITDVCEEEHVRFHFICKGRGTASSEVLDILGIGAGDKAVIICIEQEILIPVLIKEVRRKLGFYRPGAGIGFTIPLSGINTPLLRVFKESIKKNTKLYMEGDGTMAEKTKSVKAEEIHNDLIFAVINHGYSDDLMIAAKESGARGGTVISSRGLAHKGPTRFFGVSVQEEKEIVLILTGRDTKLTIMEKISESFGLTTQAEGLVFSLPVDFVMGLNLE